MRTITQPPAPAAPPPGRKTRRTVSPGRLAAGVAVVLAGGMALGVGLSTMNPVRDNVLDVSDVERDVAEILLDPIDGYGVDGLTSVRCNGGKDPVVRAGAEFFCDAVVDGKTRRVLVVFQDDAGTYAVDRPR
ncbi:DUF4333 domain-containing protein [Mycolicibacterium thermoresistibile]|uniref:DUF4333 domain-containing protein n=1 Tax=Mycolicibacterium thermoresistibile TaxID=1797 RepID=UPI001F1B1016|nr:DUF4333 domain-containing protein [Mycolicibacterium thermoresistibile]